MIPITTVYSRSSPLVPPRAQKWRCLKITEDEGCWESRGVKQLINQTTLSFSWLLTGAVKLRRGYSAVVCVSVCVCVCVLVCVCVCVCVLVCVCVCVKGVPLSSDPSGFHIQVQQAVTLSSSACPNMSAHGAPDQIEASWFPRLSFDDDVDDRWRGGRFIVCLLPLERQTTAALDKSRLEQKMTWVNHKQIYEYI